jgi:hypothetical protein
MLYSAQCGGMKGVSVPNGQLHPHTSMSFSLSYAWHEVKLSWVHMSSPDNSCSNGLPWTVSWGGMSAYYISQAGLRIIVFKLNDVRNLDAQTGELTFFTGHSPLLVWYDALQYLSITMLGYYAP